MIKTRKYEAAERKKSGSYNCAQAVICTYCDKMEISEEEGCRIGKALGGGMGNTEGTCGALVGVGIVLGMCVKDRTQAMKKMREIMNKFQDRNGATQCKLLKGVETKKVLRECPDCVADATEFLEDALFSDDENSKAD